MIEKITEKHGYLDVSGVDRKIEFEIELVKSPNAASDGSMISTSASLFSGISTKPLKSKPSARCWTCCCDGGFADKSQASSRGLYAVTPVSSGIVLCCRMDSLGYCRFCRQAV